MEHLIVSNINSIKSSYSIHSPANVVYSEIFSGTHLNIIAALILSWGNFWRLLVPCMCKPTSYADL